MANIAQDKILSIRIVADGFYFFTDSYSVFHACSSENCVAELAEAVEKMLRHSGIQFVEVKSETPRFALFPQNYASAEEQFALMFDVEENEKILHFAVPKIAMEVLFSIRKDVWQYFSAHFSNVAFVPEVSDMLSVEVAQAELSLHVFPLRFYATLAENGKLLLANAFEYESDEMLLYQVANIFTQFSLSQTETFVRYKEFGTNGEKRKLIQKYIKNIND